MREEQPELDEETRRILEEHLVTLDEHAKNAVDPREFLAEMRQRLTCRAGRASLEVATCLIKV